MIISHKYKFIFIKTAKTAGTSIEIALSKFCGPRDIITPISIEDEEIRENLGYPGPQNYLSPIWDYNWQDWRNMLSNKVRKHRFYNHISSEAIRRYVSQSVWDSYYKFCFERHPCDRIISLYYWRCREEPRPSLSEFLSLEHLVRLKQKGYDLYTINGKLVVDKVYAFEEMSTALDDIQNQLALPEKLELPRAKSSYRKDKRSYCDILSEDDQMKIADFFRQEINLLEYGDSSRACINRPSLSQKKIEE